MKSLLAFLLISTLHAANLLCVAVGGADLSGWKGLGANGEVGREEASFTFPDGPKGWYQEGFRACNDGTGDWRDRIGLRVRVILPDEEPVEIGLRIRVPEQPSRIDWVQETKASVVVRGAGEHELMLPWSSFDFLQAQPSFLKFAKTLAIHSDRKLLLKSVEVIRGEVIAMDAAIRGKSALPGQTVEYPVKVGNASDRPQAVRLQVRRHGWESMVTTVEPTQMDLAPGETKEAMVRVTVDARVPPGGRESQTIMAIPNGDGAKAVEVEFKTASQLAPPYILHSKERWDEVRKMVKSQEWAQREQQKYVTQSADWQVPEIALPHKKTADNLGEYLVETRHELDLMAAGYAWQLTRDKTHAEKAALFLRRLSDTKFGYRTTLRGSNQGFVQEGHFFQHLAMAYDMIGDSGVLTDADHKQIEAMFRAYIESDMLDLNAGAISNWSVSQHCGALYSALAIQDLSLAERILKGPGGIIDHMSHGVMDDGWWYECSISYNVWVATEFLQVAIAMQPWGVNLVDGWVPAGYSMNHGLRPWEATEGLYGMSFQKWGPVRHGHVDLKRFWDALPVLADYRGIIFGINDTTEKPLGGAGYELAYRVFRDPAYAAIIKRGGERDLIYGVPELPEKTPDLSGLSAYADNVGVAMLRSRQAEPSERIQAVLHYGTHGSFHGHFDRAGLLSMMRYGKSFYNPEMIWYGYQSFLYKFYVQTSMSKNMVVVDGKMQEPVESSRLLWYTGNLFQATAVETTARWADPPFGGMRYPELPSMLIEDKLRMEGRSFKIPQDHKPYGEIGEYGERVLQRRGMVVTDDYVLLIDSMQGNETHTYDNLLQIKGFKGLEAPVKSLKQHDPMMSRDGNSAAQFITDCNWFTTKGTAKASFEDDGLKIDVHSLWPQQASMMIANAPENTGGATQLHYRVKGDGRELAASEFGAWVLGCDDVDVSVEGVKLLELQTSVSDVSKHAIFWAGARLVMTDGKEVPLADLPVTSDGLVIPKEAGKDYQGGPIKIEGRPFATAAPGQPTEKDKLGKLNVNLSNLKAVRFKASIGADYPIGDESTQRKTYANRVSGKEAHFLTVLEPHQGVAKIKSATATSADELLVEFTDERVHEIQIDRFVGDGKDIGIKIVETKNGKTLREENTK